MLKCLFLCSLPHQQNFIHISVHIYYKMAEVIPKKNLKSASDMLKKGIYNSIHRKLGRPESVSLSVADIEDIFGISQKAIGRLTKSLSNLSLSN